MQVATAGLGVLNAKVTATGQLRYEEKVELTSQVIGRVAQILVTAGTHVKKDQVVLLLEQAELRATLEQQLAQVRRDDARMTQAQNSLQHETSKLARVSSLNQKGFNSSGALEDARFQAEQARLSVIELAAAVAYSKAVLNSVREQIAKTEVRAPRAGVVVTVDVRVGETAIPSTQSFSGASLMTIVDPRSLYLAAQVSEAHVDSLRIGQEVTIWLPNSNAATVKGKIAAIPLLPAKPQKQGAATSSGYFDVSISFDATDNARLRPGYNCRAEISLTNQEQRLLVPVEAIIENDTGTGTQTKNAERFGVWVVNNNIVNFKPVKIGLADDRMQEISEGLKVGEQLVIGPLSTIATFKNGQVVKIRPKL